MTVSMMLEKPSYQELEKQLVELEEASKKTSHQYQVLAENINDVIWTVDEKLHFTYVSPSVNSLLGYSAEESLGQHLNATMTPESRQLADNKIDQALKRLKENGGRPFDLPLMEHEMVHKNGQHIWVEVKNSFLTDENGIVNGLMGVTRDISERKRAEKEFKDSEHNYRLLAENATDIIWIMNLTTLTLDYVSPSIKRIRGYTQAEARELSLEDHFSAESYQRVVEVLDKELQNEKKMGADKNRSVVLEVQESIKGGGYLWMELIAKFIRDARGNPTAIMGVTRDIEARKMAEAMIIESERKYRQLVKYAPTGLYEIDFVKRKIVTTNDVVCEYTGYSEKELLSMDPADLLVERDRKLFLERIEQRLAGQKVPLNFEYQIKTKDGRKLWVMFNLNLTYEGGQVKGATVVAHDISDRKLAEEELSNAHAKLEIQVQQRTSELLNKTRNLEETNTALRVLLEKRDKDRVEIEENILTNVNELLYPYLEKLKDSDLSSRQMTLLNVLDSNLKDIVSSFTQRLSSKLYNLTPTELQVANFIKHGKTTKEIAVVLNLSPKTVKNHRGNIRKKLDLANKQINLRSFLLSIK
jgi:PAS domain S-box-containing protein